jgi:8-oxo-dGTP diphosphatase
LKVSNEILEILSKDKVRNINIINFIKSYPVYSAEIKGDSILIRGKSDENWVYISSESQEEFNFLASKLNDKDEYFAIAEDWMIPELTKCRDIIWKLSCMKLYMPGNIEMPENKYNIIELSSDEAEYIFNNYDYSAYTSIEYIKDRINNGIGLGIFEDHRLAAWIITHDDGAIGFLNVLPEYRKKGYGYELTTAIIKKLRAEGEIPFIHIEEDNIKSMNLAVKLGFLKDRKINWFRRSR